MIIQFGICGVHIDNGTGYRNSTVIFLAIYNTLSLRSVLRRQQGRFGLIWACMPPQKKNTYQRQLQRPYPPCPHFDAYCLVRLGIQTTRDINFNRVPPAFSLKQDIS